MKAISTPPAKVTLVPPGEPPTLAPGAAAVLLRILRDDHRRNAGASQREAA